MKPKNFLRLTAIVVIATIIASCGGGNSSVTIKPKTTTVKGDLADYFEVVNKDYVIKFDEKSIDRLIKIRDNGTFCIKCDITRSTLGTDAHHSGKIPGGKR